MSFRNKILVLPGLAALGFVALIFSNLSLGQTSSRHLEEGYFPALQVSRDLEELLAEIQRGLQNAASSMDEDELAVADGLRDRFRAKIAESKTISSHDPVQVEGLARLFEDYYRLARSSTEQMITGEMGAEGATADLAQMRTTYLALKDGLENSTEQDQEAIRVAFQGAREANAWTTTVNILIAVFSLILLSGVSLWIVRGVIGTLTEVSSYVASASAQILALSRQTESNAVDEAAFVDETRRAMEELMNAAAEISSGAATVLDQADSSAGASQAIAERISKLNAQALKITDVSETIRGIADKSEILALNASLEGTRAGEVGRGFGLVGAEMRRLAETVAAAVRQIKQLANEIRELSQAAVLATEQGLKLAEETTDTSRQISLISGQQRTATEQVNRSMSEIQEFTVQAMNGARQARATADDLVKTAAQMKSLLEGTRAEAPVTGPEQDPGDESEESAAA